MQNFIQLSHSVSYNFHTVFHKTFTQCFIYITLKTKYQGKSYFSILTNEFDLMIPRHDFRYFIAAAFRIISVDDSDLACDVRTSKYFVMFHYEFQEYQFTRSKLRTHVRGNRCYCSLDCVRASRPRNIKYAK